MIHTEQQPSIRLVLWNLQQGGGNRRELLAERLHVWQPDICVLLEYGNTDASRWVRNRLEDQGLANAIQTPDFKRYHEYGLLIASRWPLIALPVALEGAQPERWRLLQLGFASGSQPMPLTIGCLQVTGRSERPGNKYRCLESLLALAREWSYGAGIILGDFGSGQPGRDEEQPYFNEREQSFMEDMAAIGWIDAFRHLHKERRSYSWWRTIEGKRAGLRVDHAFISPSLRPHLLNCELIHESECWTSDHAALLVDLTMG